MEKEELEDYLAEGLSLAQIGKRVGLEKSTVSYHLRRYGLKPVNQGRAANRGGLSEATLEELVREGLTLTEMARQLDRSVSTIRYWLKKYGHWPLAAGRRRIAAQQAREDGLARVELDCIHHGRTEFILESGVRYRCLKCRRQGVIDWRRRAKLRLVEGFGGRCELCGYDEFLGALQFHHVDPELKEFGLAMRGLTRSMEALRKEAAKCVLLCANCHAKVEWGAQQLPEELVARCRSAEVAGNLEAA
jgi:DNA-binding CsgD family transcriptional regulator